jgi:hypothetical protein
MITVPSKWYVHATTLDGRFQIRISWPNAEKVSFLLRFYAGLGTDGTAFTWLGQRAFGTTRNR